MTEELGTYASTRRMTIASSPAAAITCEEKRYTLVQKGVPCVNPVLVALGCPCRAAPAFGSVGSQAPRWLKAEHLRV